LIAGGETRVNRGQTEEAQLPMCHALAHNRLIFSEITGIRFVVLRTKKKKKNELARGVLPARSQGIISCRLHQSVLKVLDLAMANKSSVILTLTFSGRQPVYPRQLCFKFQTHSTRLPSHFGATGSASILSTFNLRHRGYKPEGYGFDSR
jgi:hypothetical protein